MGYVNEEGRLRILPYHDFNKAPHGYGLCPPNMCKVAFCDKELTVSSVNSSVVLRFQKLPGLNQERSVSIASGGRRSSYQATMREAGSSCYSCRCHERTLQADRCRQSLWEYTQQAGDSIHL
ncbi:hypothetical protein K1719_031277 [Acacia pycnantha]|nr:hypothetical protein K1719_031277 [Acacia pycnantha]